MCARCSKSNRRKTKLQLTERVSLATKPAHGRLWRRVRLPVISIAQTSRPMSLSPCPDTVIRPATADDANVLVN